MAEPAIVITKDGPYLVSGGLPLAEQALTLDAEGNTWDYEDTGREVAARGEQYALCRCGHSQDKPFCDGSHKRVGFDGTEVASRAPFAEEAEVIEGLGATLADDRPLCAFARICDAHGRIWNTVHQSDDEARRAVVVHQATHCPSGRLVITEAGAAEPVELEFEPSIVLLEDPQEEASGPIWVRGGVALTGADGFAYEIRNRVTLCRCGASSNKPFCDGTHAHIGFRAHDADGEGTSQSG